MKWIAYTQIEFTDGGEPELTVLSEGTEEECVSVMNLINAVAYSGNRPVARSFVNVGQVKE